MTLKSHCWRYTLRTLLLKETHVPHGSLQHYLQELEHGTRMSINRRMDKEVAVHIHDGILLTITRDPFESALMRWMDLEPIIQSQVSQREKDKYHILTHIYMESRKMVLKNLFTGQQWRNRHRE